MLLPGPRPASRLVPLLAVVGLAITSPPGVRDAAAKGDGKGDATAEREPDETAAEFDRLGKAAYKQQKWDDAIAAFEGAYAADPLPRFLYNLGRCHEKKGDLARASHYFERYLTEAPDAKDHRKVEALAKMLRIRLAKSSSKLVVTTDAPKALVQVFVGGEPLQGASPFSYWVPFGKYRVVVEKDGFETWKGTVVVTPNETAQLAVKLSAVEGEEPAEAAPALEATAPAGEVAGPAEPVASEVAPSEPEVAAGPPAPELQPADAPEPAPAVLEDAPEGGAPAWLAPAALGLGGSLLAGGAVFGWLSSDAEAERDAALEDSWERGIAYSTFREHDDAARSRALVANVLYGLGAVAAISGAVMWWTTDGEPTESAGGLKVAPTPGGATLVWTGGTR